MQEVEFQSIQVSPAFASAMKESSQNEGQSQKSSKNIVQQDIELVQKEISQCKKFTQGISSVMTRLSKSKQECSESINLLLKQSTQLSDKISLYQKGLDQNLVKTTQAQIESNKKRYITLWEERILHADKLKTQPLRQIEIEDRKSMANELFKWILVVIYGENENKFYLPNFKEQLFEKDGGKDFRERLGKINAASAKEEQILKAKDFISKFYDIVACEELKDCQTEAQTLRKIAQIFVLCYELVKKSSELQKSIEHDKETSLQKDQEAMKWKAKHEALEERMGVLNQYLNTLESTGKQLEVQEKRYQEKKIILDTIVSKLKKGEMITENELNSLKEI